MSVLIRLSLLLPFLILGHAIQGQTFTKLRPFRHDTALVRATLAANNAPFAVRFAKGASVHAELRADDHRPPRTLTVTIHHPQRSDTHRLPWPDDFTPGQTILIRRHGSVLDLATPQRLIARFPAPHSFRGDVLAAVDAQGQACLADAHYQRLQPITFGDDFMRTEEEAKQWGLWQPVAGNWRIHSVMERIQDNPAAQIRPGKLPSADRSPNPFTLEGRSEAEAQLALIVTGQPYWHDYRVSVTLRPRLATAGLIFAYANQDNFWRLAWTLSSSGTKNAPLTLIQRLNGVDYPRAQTNVPGRSDNWARLSVAINGKTLTATIDHCPVLTFQTDRAPQGLVGLHTTGSQATAFDDFSVSSSHLTCFTPQNAANSHWKASTENLLVAATDNALLPFGSDIWPAQRLRTTLPRAVSRSHTGFACGPLFRYLVTCSQDDTRKTYRLYDRQTGTTLQQLTLPADHAAPTTLLLDTSERHTLALRDGTRLVLRHASPDLPNLAGPVALYAEKAGSIATLPEFFVAFDRDWEKPVDIERFANDPFMQGWASSRYAWSPLTPGATAYPQTFLFTGDIYGAFKLETPILDKLQLRFGSDTPNDDNAYQFDIALQPDTSSATLTLSRKRRQLARTTLHNLKLTVLPGTQIIDEKIGARPRTPDTRSWGSLTLQRDGHLLWLEHQGQTILSVSDPAPLPGRVCTVTVPEKIDFIHLNLTREHVKDYLFERSEHDWSALGTWEVTNRFACDPRWSHMNGESFGTAALWSKFSLEGDFTIECFAGMRMRQGALKENARMHYPRVGDINIACQADGQELFSGYNLLIAAWDPQWSETWTQLLRQNTILAQTDRELIPRGRRHSPKARPIKLEWDPGSRPVHGAWYALKFRKTGPRLEAWFDNQKILDATDANPLDAQHKIALWTQHNSIVLARVKVNYRQLVFRPPVADTHTSSLADKLAAQTTTTADFKPFSHSDTQNWQHRLTPWNGDQSPEIATFPQHKLLQQAVLLENVNSGGDFAVRFNLENKNECLDTTWLEFDCSFSADACFNLYLDSADYAHDRAFVAITGPDHSAPGLTRLGKARLTRIPGITTAGQPWYHVAIPLSALMRTAFPFLKNPGLDHLMLGMLHEGYLNAGQQGNHRGAWLILDNCTLRTLTPAQHDALPEAQRFRLHPVQPAPRGDWDLGDIVVNLGEHSVLTPRLAGATLTANDQTIPLTPLNATLKERTLTIRHPFKPFSTPEVTFTLQVPHPLTQQPCTRQWTAKLNHALDKTPPTPPTVSQVISRLTSLATAENDILSATRKTNDTIYQLAPRSDAPWLPQVTVITRVPGSRNLLDFNMRSINQQQSPWLCADLLLTPNAYIDVTTQVANATRTLGLSDRNAEAPGYDGSASPKVVPDGQWHPVLLNLSPPPQTIQAGKPRNYRRLTWGATGYSGAAPGTHYAVSNLRFASYVTANTQRPLILKCLSQDTAGVKAFAWKWSPQHDDQAPDARVTTQETLTFTDLPDGLHFLHLRAQDHNGNWSQTAHLPFVIDNSSPTLRPDTPTSAPEQLTATASADCQSILLDQASVTLDINGKNAKPFSQKLPLAYDEANRQLIFRHTDFALPFRSSLHDQAHITATLSGLTNAAGTPIPPLTWSWQLDRKADQTPPEPPQLTAIGLQLFSRQHTHFEERHPEHASLAHAYASLLQDELTRSTCLNISSPARQACLIPLNKASISEKNKYLRFKCRLLDPKTQINLYISAPGGNRTIVLNGPKDDHAIASIPTLKADGQWHSVLIDLHQHVFSKLNLPAHKRNLWRISIGRSDKPSSPLNFRLDDISFIQDLPPAFRLTAFSQDTSGIDTILLKATPTTPETIDQDEQQSKLTSDHACSSSTSLLLNKPGLWLIQAAARDGAGNLSPVVTFPVTCSATTAPTLPNLTASSWRVLERNSRKPARAIAFATPRQDTSRPLLLQIFKRKKQQEFFLITHPSPQALAGKSPIAGLQADTFLTVNTSAKLTLQPIALNQNLDILASGAKTSLTAQDDWTLNRHLTFPTTLASAPHYLGFLVTCPPNCTMTLLLNNISLLTPAQP